MKIAGVVLAGGQSKRMKTDKSQLKIGQNTLLQHTKKIVLSTRIKNIFVSSKYEIKDTYKNKGPVAGMYSCLLHLKEFDHLLFIPVDMPLLNKYVLLKLINEKNSNGVHFENNQFPILLENNLINRKIIKQQLESNKLSVKNMLNKLDACSIKSHFPQDVFTNTNTEKEWFKILKQLNESQSL